LSHKTLILYSSTGLQVYFAFLCYLVHAGIFHTIYASYLPPGHTHNIIDQHFSVVSKDLKGQDVLTVPSIIHIIKDRFKSDGDLRGHFQLDNGVADFHTFLKAFSFKALHGHNTTTINGEKRRPHAFKIQLVPVHRAESTSCEGQPVVGVWYKEHDLGLEKWQGEYCHRELGLPMRMFPISKFQGGEKQLVEQHVTLQYGPWSAPKNWKDVKGRVDEMVDKLGQKVAGQTQRAASSISLKVESMAEGVGQAKQWWASLHETWNPRFEQGEGRVEGEYPQEVVKIPKECLLKMRSHQLEPKMKEVLMSLEDFDCHLSFETRSSLPEEMVESWDKLKAVEGDWKERFTEAFYAEERPKLYLWSDGNDRPPAILGEYGYEEVKIGEIAVIDMSPSTAGRGWEVMLVKRVLPGEKDEEGEGAAVEQPKRRRKEAVGEEEVDKVDDDALDLRKFRVKGWYLMPEGYKDLPTKKYDGFKEDFEDKWWESKLVPMRESRAKDARVYTDSIHAENIVWSGPLKEEKKNKEYKVQAKHVQLLVAAVKHAERMAKQREEQGEVWERYRPGVVEAGSDVSEVEAQESGSGSEEEVVRKQSPRRRKGRGA